MSLRLRLLVVAAVAALCIWMVHPPGETLRLGLDLRGGVQMILRVQTEDVLRLETERSADRLRLALVEHGVAFSRVAATGPLEFVIEGLADEEALRSIPVPPDDRFAPTRGNDPGPERSAAVRAREPGRTTFRMRPAAEATIRDETVEAALRTIERRVNELGVTEPVVAKYSQRDHILVELPGMPDIERAKQTISTTAQVRLTLAVGGPFPSREAAAGAHGRALPSHLEILPGRGGTEAGDAYWIVHRSPAVTGTDIRNARQSFDEFNRPAVAFTLSPESARRFGTFTGQNIGRLLATVLDDRVMSVATIVSRIDAEGQIRGVSHDEMLAQVVTLRSGALPADLEYASHHAIGPSLGADSVRAGLRASIAGLLLVGSLMLWYYRLTGVVAIVSIVLNLAILLAVAAYVPVTLTLPGIAGLVLTIGMGVDSNVLIFERIREEVAAGRTARAAMLAGFSRAWATIVDTHVASLLGAAFLYQFGTSSIRGFATMLAIGLLANVFTAVFVSRAVFELALGAGRAERIASAGRRSARDAPASTATSPQ